jgi:hypothetical protein
MPVEESYRFLPGDYASQCVVFGISPVHIPVLPCDQIGEENHMPGTLITDVLEFVGMAVFSRLCIMVSEKKEEGQV